MVGSACEEGGLHVVVVMVEDEVVKCKFATFEHEMELVIWNVVGYHGQRY